MLPITCPLGKEGTYDGELLLITFAVNHYIVDHLLRTMRRFRLDMESVAVWSLLAHLNVVHLIPPGATPDVVLGRTGKLLRDDAKLRRVRLRDLQQISMLPRETIRRKLSKLLERELVSQTNHGWALHNLYVDEGIREFMWESAIRVAKLCNEINRIKSLELYKSDNGHTIPWRL